MKTVIIGGVAGGATTAARLRRLDESMEIVMFEKGAYISYANCGLPYYIGNAIRSRDSLLLQTPKAMQKKMGIDVRVSSEVVSIDPAKKMIHVINHVAGTEYDESYDKLVMATGSSPLRPRIPGIDSKRVYTLWTIPDTDAIKEFLTSQMPKSVAIIGGGFIGLEMAENLVELGIHVSLIEMQKQVMAPLDLEMATLIHENLHHNGVELILEDGVESFEETNEGIRMHLTSKRVVNADIVLLAIGVKPNNTLAKDAGLRLGDRGGIWVDEYLQTSAEDIYAVGDVVEVTHFVSKQKVMIPLAGPANKQARILADNLLGRKIPYHGSLGTSVVKIFDLTAASVGLNEKQLQALGKVKNTDYESILIHQKSHAGYYPGATPMYLKLLFEKEGAILGAQIVGQEGVDKRIDTIATTMRLGHSVQELMDLELAYAPPFSSAKDPVNMLGYVAENVIRNIATFIMPDEIDRMLEQQKEDVIVLDVTEEMERMVFAIPGSYHIPLGQLRERMYELNPDKIIIPYCAVGIRSYNAARILMQNGFQKVRILAGGTSFYKSMHYLDHNETVSAGPLSDTGAGQSVGGKQSSNDSKDVIVTKEERLLDCSGLQCPGPIMKVHEAICSMHEGEILKVSATDLGFARDIDAWCKRTGNELIRVEKNAGEQVVYVRKGLEKCQTPEGIKTELQLPQGKTIIVFSGDLDKVLAAFIVANGAAAMGRPVTMFFTFWGLNALRKSNAPKVKKNMVESMFGHMMPKGSKKLKLSKMNMAGMGTSMMKGVMKKKNVNTLEELMQMAMKSGVKLVACTMSMDIMGIKEEELMDGVELGGVAAYLGDAEMANVNLFIS